MTMGYYILSLTMRTYDNRIHEMNKVHFSPQLQVVGGTESNFRVRC